MVAWPKEECCTREVWGLPNFQETGICCQFLNSRKQGSAARDPVSLSTLAILTLSSHAGLSAMDGGLESYLLAASVFLQEDNTASPSNFFMTAG